MQEAEAAATENAPRAAKSKAAKPPKQPNTKAAASSPSAKKRPASPATAKPAKPAKNPKTAKAPKAASAADGSDGDGDARWKLPRDFATPGKACLVKSFFNMALTDEEQVQVDQAKSNKSRAQSSQADHDNGASGQAGVDTSAHADHVGHSAVVAVAETHADDDACAPIQAFESDQVKPNLPATEQQAQGQGPAAHDSDQASLHDADFDAALDAALDAEADAAPDQHAAAAAAHDVKAQVEGSAITPEPEDVQPPSDPAVDASQASYQAECLRVSACRALADQQHHRKIKLMNLMNWPEKLFQRLCDATDATTRSQPADPEHLRSGLLDHIVQCIDGLRISSAFSGIDTPSIALNSISVAAAKCQQTPLDSRAKCRNLYGVEWFGKSQIELQHMPDGPECIFGDINDFWQPGMRERVGPLLEQGQFIEVMKKMISSVKVSSLVKKSAFCINHHQQCEDSQVQYCIIVADMLVWFGMLLSCV